MNRDKLTLFEEVEACLNGSYNKEIDLRDYDTDWIDWDVGEELEGEAREKWIETQASDLWDSYQDHLAELRTEAYLRDYVDRGK